MNGLNWFWVAAAALVPSVVGVAVAAPFWTKNQPVFGNIVGSAVVFGGAVALILRERLELDRLALECLDRGVVCWPVPSAFARFAVYAFIALFQIIALFSISLRVEHKIRRRGYAPEWR